MVSLFSAGGPGLVPPTTGKLGICTKKVLTATTEPTSDAYV